MTYSCSDFTDDILRALEIAPDDETDLDETGAHACYEILRLQVIAQRHIQMRAELAGLCAVIKAHYDGDEQDLDVIADGLVKDFDLQPDIDATVKF